MARVCARVRTGEGRRLCVWMSVGGEEVGQASAQAICTCTKTVALGSPVPGLGLRLALRGATRPPSPRQTPAGAGHGAGGGARAEGDVGGLGGGCSGGQALPWVRPGQKCQRRPRSVTRGQDPAALSGASWPCFWAGRGGSTYLDHGGWVLKAWSHRWRGPAAGESSSASSVPGPRAQRACSTKRHSEEGLLPRDPSPERGHRLPARRSARPGACAAAAPSGGGAGSVCKERGA